MMGISPRARHVNVDLPKVGLRADYPPLVASRGAVVRKFPIGKQRWHGRDGTFSGVY